MKWTCHMKATPRLSVCSNVQWSLRSKRSALRVKMLKSANGESELICPDSEKQKTRSWRFVSSVFVNKENKTYKALLGPFIKKVKLTQSLQVWIFRHIFSVLCPTGAQWSWCSGKSSTPQRVREWRPQLKPPGTLSCLTNHCMSRPVWTKRWVTSYYSVSSHTLNTQCSESLSVSLCHIEDTRQPQSGEQDFF